MCGIVGYVGHSDRAQDVIIDGLRRLEYRGYDSAGVAILEGEKLRVIRAQGKLVNLESALRDVPLAGSLGIGHTRWATHGKPSERNAHPHLAGTVAVIGNGIIENFRALRDELAACGSVFNSETDTEIISHLVFAERKTGKSLRDSVRAALRRLEGSYAIAVVDETAPDEIVIAKNGGNPIVVGLGIGENFIASDIATILPYTRQMQILQDAELAVVTREGVAITTFDGAPVERARKLIQWDPVQAEKGGYDRFMQKEIFEQPRAISDTIGTRVREDEGDIDLDGISLDRDMGARARRDPARRLRNGLARGDDRALDDRAARADPVRRRPRERVPLPRADRLGATSRDPRLAVGRDRGYDRRAARSDAPRREVARGVQRAREHDRARPPTTCSTRTPDPRSASHRRSASRPRSWRSI